MPNTYPNQKVVVIHRDMPQKEEGGFLLIKKENLYNAYRDLNATALVLYLYLAGNKENFSLALSRAAVHQEVGMPLSTYDDQVKKLIEKKYLVQKESPNENSNIYDFYEKPLKEAQTAGV